MRQARDIGKEKLGISSIILFGLLRVAQTRIHHFGLMLLGKER